MRGVRVPVGARAALAVAILMAPGASDLAHAQERPECEAGDCRRVSDDLAESANRIRQARSDFVLALRRLLEALPGTHGDEGPALRGAVAALSEALGRWDRAIRAYQAPLISAAGNPDVHVALGTVQFERGRPRLAANEFAAASRLAPERAQVFLLLGLAHDAAGRHADAAKAFEKASTLVPDNVAALYAAAQQRRRAGDRPQALDALRIFATKAQATAGSTRGQSPFLRAGLLRESAAVAPIIPPASYSHGFDALARGAYEEAVAAFDQAVARDPVARPPPPAAAAALAAGSAALRAGDLRVALGQLEAAARGAPDASEARRLFATALTADDRPAEAVEQLEAAVKLNPQDERARVALARALVAAGRHADAERSLVHAVAAIPTSAQARYELGRLYQLLERPRNAADAYTAAAAFHVVVGQERLYELIGRARLADADFDAALAAFVRRIDASPNHAEAHRTLGEAYSQLGRDDEALAELIAASLIDPADPQTHAERAQIHLRNGRYEAAAVAARAALERDPSSPGALYALGASLLRLGRAAEGTDAIERFQSNQTAARARDQQAWDLKQLRQVAGMHAERGEFGDAAARLREALTLEPTVDAYLSLGVVLKRGGRPREALEALEQAAARGAGPEVHALLAEVYVALGQTEASGRQQELAARAREQRFRAGGGR